MGKKWRSPGRTQFLADLLVGAVENGGYGGLRAKEWHCPEGKESEWWALMYETDEADEVLHRVDLDTMARGVGVIAKSQLQVITSGHNAGDRVLHNRKTGERLYLSEARKRDIMAASFSNDAAGSGEAGDLDVIHYLAILECGIYGKVVYG